jgi:3-dehydroquinate dehydratase II
MFKILLLQGANANYLATREPDIYGSTTVDELNAMLHRHAEEHGDSLDIFYTNVEGKVITHTYRAVDQGVDGLVMNPAGFSYAGYALKDCVKGASLPYVEIHISHIHKRKIESVLSEAAEGVITGFGVYGYLLALDAILHLLNQRANVP